MEEKVKKEYGLAIKNLTEDDLLTLDYIYYRSSFYPERLIPRQVVEAEINATILVDMQKKEDNATGDYYFWFSEDLVPDKFFKAKTKSGALVKMCHYLKKDLLPHFYKISSCSEDLDSSIQNRRVVRSYEKQLELISRITEGNIPEGTMKRYRHERMVYYGLGGFLDNDPSQLEEYFELKKFVSVDVI